MGSTTSTLLPASGGCFGLKPARGPTPAGSCRFVPDVGPGCAIQVLRSLGSVVEIAVGPVAGGELRGAGLPRPSAQGLAFGRHDRDIDVLVQATVHALHADARRPPAVASHARQNGRVVAWRGAQGQGAELSADQRARHPAGAREAAGEPALPIGLGLDVADQQPAVPGADDAEFLADYDTALPVMLVVV